MKPFNLEEAKAGKPVVTRDGLPVRIICFDAKICLSRPIYALITDISRKKEFACMYTEEGHCDYSSYNLCMKTEKKTGWTNLYKSPNNPNVIAESSCVYVTEEQAKLAGIKSRNYLGAFKIEWEE